jgi:nickel-dependent lactate racemase
MRFTIPYGQQSHSIIVDESQADVVFAQSKNPVAARSWEAVVAEALAEPIGVPPISAQDLRDKKAVILTDDWDRPTPAYLVIPLLLKELAATGIADEGITFVTASGMHDPLGREGLERKLGAEVVARYRCLAHDGGDWENLAFLGHSSLGTPIWVNRYVADADYRIALGRVYLHGCYGYEGGYKMILPGVSGFDTILRDHGLNFSATSLPGIHENPSRAEADNVGRLVGLDFLINVVVNGRGEPFRAFAGAVAPVHRRAIAYGDREIWGAEVGEAADVTLVSHGADEPPPAGYLPETVRRACSVTRAGGTVIVVSSRSVPPLPDWRAGEQADDAALDRLPRAEFGPRLRPLAYSEVVRLHERRDWPLPLREIQWRVKALRGEFYRRRWLMAAETRQVVFTEDPQAALERALDGQGGRPRLLILPSGKATMPKPRLYAQP